MYDVIGGGPAGAFCAEELARKGFAAQEPSYTVYRTEYDHGVD